MHGRPHARRCLSLGSLVFDGAERIFWHCMGENASAVNPRSYVGVGRRFFLGILRDYQKRGEIT